MIQIRSHATINATICICEQIRVYANKLHGRMQIGACVHILSKTLQWSEGLDNYHNIIYYCISAKMFFF